MKKLLVLLLSLFLITSCSTKINFDEKNYEEVSFKTIEEKINNDETFVFYIGSDTCSSCEEYNKTLSKYFETHSEDKIYYVDVNDNFAQGQDYYYYRTELANIAYILDGTGEIFNYDKNVLYTPTTFKIINGEYSFAKIGSLIPSLLEAVFDLEYNNINYVDHNLNYEETVMLLNREEDYTFFFTQNGCPNCLEFKLLVNSFDKQETPLNLYNMTFTNDIVRDEERMNYLKSFIYNNIESDVTFDEFEVSVPTLVKKRNGKITITIGVPSYDELKEFLK